MELRFGNVSIALLALLSTYWTDSIMPAAIVGAVFYGLTGLQHRRNRERTGLVENIATASDLFIASIAIFYLVAMLRCLGSTASLPAMGSDYANPFTLSEIHPA
jgi:hypothetical protein